jgi:hypothetical protein
VGARIIECIGGIIDKLMHAIIDWYRIKMPKNLDTKGITYFSKRI